MKFGFWAIVIMILLSSCASQSEEGRDKALDTKLGLLEEVQSDDANKTLQDLQEIQRQEQRRHLERQVTDPLK